MSDGTPGSIKNGRLLPYVLLALILLPAALVLLYIAAYGVNVFFNDEWFLVPLVDKLYSSTLSPGDLFAQHNEHRIFFPRLIILAAGYFTRFDTRPMMYMSFIVSLVSFATIGLAYREKFGAGALSMLTLVPISWLYFSLRQFENILWGWQIALYLCVLGFIASLFFLGRSKGIDRFYILAILSAVLATFSFVNGLLAWPVCLVYLGLGKKFKLMLPWATIGVLCYGLYFYGWTHPGYHPPMDYFLENPVAAAGYFLSAIGAPFTFEVNTAIVFGALMLAIFIALLAYDIKHKRLVQNSFFISLVLFALGTAFLCMVGRSGLGMYQALSSRYTTFTILGIIGIFALALDGYVNAAGGARKKFKLCALAMAAMMVIGTAAGLAYGLYEGKKIMDSRDQEIALLKNFDNLDRGEMLTILSDEAVLKRYVGIAREYRINVFAP